MQPTNSPFAALRALSRLSSHTQASRIPPLTSRLASRFQPLPNTIPKRFHSSQTPQPLSSSTPSTHKPTTSSSHKPPAYARPPQPEYQLTFTCDPCSTRSTHRVSKQGYHKGSVLITCPECRNRHVISDHLNIFGDRNLTIEDLMKEKGQLVKKGTLSEDGDVEFWEDETVGTNKGARGEGEGAGRV